MKPKSRTKPQTLDDLVFGAGLPLAETYGWMDMPDLSQADQDRLYHEATDVLRKGFQEFDGVAIMTLLAVMEKVSAVDAPRSRVDIAVLEFAQTLLLRTSANGAAPAPDDVHRLTDALDTYLRLFIDQTSKPGADKAAELLARRRHQTLRARHTFYPHHARKIFQMIGHELAPFGKHVLGMSLQDASEVAMVAAMAVARLVDESPIVEEITSWLNGVRPFDPTWCSLFEVPLARVAGAFPNLSTSAVAVILDKLSLEPGALAPMNPDYLPLDNPMWRRPFVKIDDRWFCFSPGTLFSAHADVLSTLAEGISKTPGEVIGKARGAALETMAAGVLRAVFPHGEVLTSVFWTDPVSGEEHETDVMLLIDGHALIFEAKGHVLSNVARRGSADWFRLFDDVVAEAALQTSRLEAALRHPADAALALRTDQGFRTLIKADIRHIARFGVSLERVTMASYGVDNALRDRIVRLGGTAMPIFTIGDLLLMRELIGSEGRCLHYLLRRSDLERDCEFIGDELDLLALYLKTGFVRLWASEAKMGPLVVYGLSDLLRYHVRHSGHHDPKCRLPKLTSAWWDRIIVQRELKRPNGWTDMIHDLLNVPLASQERFWKDIVALRRKLRRSPSKGAYNGVLMQVHDQLRPTHFTCLVTGRMPDVERVRAARSIFAEQDQKHPNERLFVFHLDGSGDLKDPVLPYYRGVSWTQDAKATPEVGVAITSGLVVFQKPPAPD